MAVAVATTFPIVLRLLRAAENSTRETDPREPEFFHAAAGRKDG